MVERWLQWIVIGAAVAIAVFWIGAATVTAPAMEPPLIPAHRPPVDATTLAKADPLRNGLARQRRHIDQVAGGSSGVAASCGQ
jgi:hypothetical protein